MDAEDADKTLQFLDLKIKNTEGKYVTSIFRKNAITNVQVKPRSGHDPKILKGIFTGFLHRAYAICQLTQREEEIEFLIRCFTENGYDNNDLKRNINEEKYKVTSLENFRHSLNRYLQAPPLYVCKAIDKLTKNHRENDKESSSGIMPEIKDSDLCPVKSFISYFEKLNPNTDRLW